jgi:hypothetical protein
LQNVIMSRGGQLMSHGHWILAHRIPCPPSRSCHLLQWKLPPCMIKPFKRQPPFSGLWSLRDVSSTSFSSPCCYRAHFSRLPSSGSTTGRTTTSRPRLRKKLAIERHPLVHPRSQAQVPGLAEFSGHNC